jgi:hypothetical protein
MRNRSVPAVCIDGVTPEKLVFGRSATDDLQLETEKSRATIWTAMKKQKVAHPWEDAQLFEPRGLNRIATATVRTMPIQQPIDAP